MIDTRRKAHAERLPKLLAVVDHVDIDALEARRNELEARVTAIERDNDVVRLATAEEQERWNRIQHIEQVLAKADASDPQIAEMREKLRMLHGVLYWDLNAGYKARLWREHKQLRELDVALKDARRHQILLGRAHEEGPRRTEEFSVRVENLGPRIAGLSARLATAAEAQSSYLAAIATTELEAQKERLSSYSLQAQFALASIYDRAASAPAPARGAAQ
jgi:chromosome segregation ATPase